MVNKITAGALVILLGCSFAALADITEDEIDKAAQELRAQAIKDATPTPPPPPPAPTQTEQNANSQIVPASNAPEVVPPQPQGVASPPPLVPAPVVVPVPANVEAPPPPPPAILNNPWLTPNQWPAREVPSQGGPVPASEVPPPLTPQGPPGQPTPPKMQNAPQPAPNYYSPNGAETEGPPPKNIYQ